MTNWLFAALYCVSVRITFNCLDINFIGSAHARIMLHQNQDHVVYRYIYLDLTGHFRSIVTEAVQLKCRSAAKSFLI